MQYRKVDFTLITLLNCITLIFDLLIYQLTRFEEYFYQLQTFYDIPIWKSGPD